MDRSIEPPETIRKVEDEQIEKKELVSLKLGEEEFATHILSVREIIRYQEVTEVPNTPVFIKGIINLRGRVIPVIDLRKRLGLSEKKTEMKTRILVVEIDDRLIGFIVDEVTGVITIPSNIIEKAPDVVVSGVDSAYITGVCKVDNRLLIILDFDQILRVSEKEKLKQLANKQSDKLIQ